MKPVANVLTFPERRFARDRGAQLKFRRSAAMAVVFGYLTLIVAAMELDLTWVLVSLLVALPIIGLAGWHFYRLTQLNKRIAASIGPVWNIVIGGVPAGTIKDAEYAAIKHRCLNNPSLVWAQVLSYFRHPGRMMVTVWRAVPVWLFWVLVLSALIEPRQAVTAIAQLGKSSPDELQALLAALLKLITVLVFVSVGVMQVFRNHEPDEVDSFDEAVDAAIRVHCGDTSSAPVSLYCWKYGNLHIDDVKTSVHRPTTALE